MTRGLYVDIEVGWCQLLLVHYVFSLVDHSYIFLVLWGEKKNHSLSFHGFLHIGHFGVVFLFDLLFSLFYAFFMSFLSLNPSFVVQQACSVIAYIHQSSSYISSNFIICCYHLFMGGFTSHIYFSVSLFSCYILRYLSYTFFFVL